MEGLIITDQQLLRIKVDSREPERIAKLLKDFGASVNYEEEIPTGDYIFQGKDDSLYIIERKAVNDFFSSFKDGRLKSQLTRLKDLQEENPNVKPYLLLEGSRLEFVYGKRRRKKGAPKKKGWNASSVWGLTLSVPFKWNIPIIQSENLFYSAFTIWQIMKMVNAEKAPKSLVTSNKTGFSEYDLRLMNLQNGIPKIGAIKSKELIESLYSLRGIYGASLESLQSVLGEILGKEVYDFINKDVAKK